MGVERVKYIYHQVLDGIPAWQDPIDIIVLHENSLGIFYKLCRDRAVTAHNTTGK